MAIHSAVPDVSPCRKALIALGKRRYPGIGGILMSENLDLTPEAAVRAVMQDILGLDADQVSAFTADTELFGALPELDSMAVAGLLTELEDRLNIMIEDDEVDGEMFETFGNLVAFAEMKAAE